MPDEFAQSNALLERLLAQLRKESDPAKYDQVAAEIHRVVEEREHLRTALELRRKLGRQKPPRFGA